MFGYTDSTNGFRTIMGIDASLSRIQYFSNPNPNYTFNKMPIGTSTANCVSMMNSNLYTVANYRLSSKRTITGPTPPVAAPQTPTRKPTRRPTRQPTRKPTRQPTKSKVQANITRKPTLKPVRKPTSRPTNPIPTCISQSSCSQSQISMILRLDRPQEISWSVMDTLTNQTYCRGGPYSSSSISPLTYCLLSSKSLKLQLRDVGTVGFLASSSTYNVTVGTSGTASYKFFTKNNSQKMAFWRSHNFTT